MTSEEGPKSTPIHIVFGTHSRESSTNITSLVQLASSYLQASPIGRIVWFKEAADVSLSKAAVFKAHKQEGVEGQLEAWIKEVYPPYSRLSRLVKVYPQEKQTKAKGELRRDILRTGLALKQSFVGQTLVEIDSLGEKHPRRVVLVVEEASDQEIDDKLAADKLIEKNRNRSDRLVENGLFSDALPYFEAAETIFAYSYLKSRDPRITTILENEVEDPDVFAEIGHLGAAHTGVYFALKKDGYNVSREFPEREGASYWYDPRTAATRTLSFFPEKVWTSEQWLKILVQHAVFSVLEQRRRASTFSGLPLLPDRPSFFDRLRAIPAAAYLRWRIPDVPRTQQGVVKLVYDLTKDFDQEKIKIFEARAKEIGIHDAVAKLISSKRDFR